MISLSPDCSVAESKVHMSPPSISLCCYLSSDDIGAPTVPFGPLLAMAAHSGLFYIVDRHLVELASCRQLAAHGGAVAERCSDLAQAARLSGRDQ